MGSSVRVLRGNRRFSPTFCPVFTPFSAEDCWLARPNSLPTTRAKGVKLGAGHGVVGLLGRPNPVGRAGKPQGVVPAVRARHSCSTHVARSTDPPHSCTTPIYFSRFSAIVGADFDAGGRNVLESAVVKGKKKKGALQLHPATVLCSVTTRGGTEYKVIVRHNIRLTKERGWVILRLSRRVNVHLLAQETPSKMAASRWCEALLYALRAAVDLTRSCCLVPWPNTFCNAESFSRFAQVFPVSLFKQTRLLRTILGL